MAESVLRDKAKNFAKEIVLLCRQIKATHKEAVLKTNSCVPVLLSAQTYTRRNTHKVQRILSLNLRLR